MNRCRYYRAYQCCKTEDDEQEIISESEKAREPKEVD